MCSVDFYSSHVRCRLDHETLGYQLIDKLYNVKTQNGFSAFINEFGFKFLNKTLPKYAQNELQLSVTTTPFIVKGYYQSSRFWDKGAIEILEYIDLTHLLQPVKAKEMVIHLRGGDYLLDKNKALLSTLDCSLAETFVNKCRNDSNNHQMPLTIVTDDPEFAKTWLNGMDAEIINSNNMLDDFSILANSKYLLTSESTFSILAGLYSFSNSGIVYSPKTTGLKLDFDFFKLPWELI